MQVVKANILILFLLGYLSVKSQTFIEGQVFDVKTKEPVSYANIYIKGTTVGTTTDDTGYYQLKLTNNYDSISAAYLGYTEGTQAIKKQPKQRIDFLLEASQSMLAEAVIVASKESLEDYLIRKILENKDHNDKKHLQNYSYEFYNKIELDVK
ncbi:MAG TPA: carboxypeptidase-like regulatory domain-containing protein, partial [Chitinophagales bacterium]|nr:carboxypeptidase-like regulatory domain-containing protein [Chitinophagales bacterium]